jgi:lipopolysaccharide biosynthesis protein
MRRLGIYLYYDPDGVVDDYVPFFLQQLSEYCDELAVVINGDVDVVGKTKLESHCNKVFVRENIGYDSWAYKHVLEQYGYERIQEFDELIICNYTFWGPIYPFAELFNEMGKRNCDFWGIHKHPAIPSAAFAGVSIEDHIQSHFIVFRNSILSDPKFQEYWDTLKPVNNYLEAIAHHELRCTKYFESLGYKSECYLDPDKYFKLFPESNASICYAYHQLEMDRCPILKRKALFIQDGKISWPLQDGHDSMSIISFLRKNTSYDVDLIKKNLLRTKGATFFNGELPNNLHLKGKLYALLARLIPWKRAHYLKKYAKYYQNTQCIRRVDFDRYFDR